LEGYGNKRKRRRSALARHPVQSNAFLNLIQDEIEKSK
jgi:hypothetical protein